MTTPESEFADREVSYDEVEPVTTRVRVHSNHISPVSPPGVAINNIDVTDGNFSMDELKQSGLLAGECVGSGIVSIKGTKGERPLSSHFPLHMPGLNKQVRSTNITSPSPDSMEEAPNTNSTTRQLTLQRMKHFSEDNTNENFTSSGYKFSGAKFEDYGFQIFSIGSGNKCKLLIEPTKDYEQNIRDYLNLKHNSVLLPGDELIAINSVQITNDQTGMKQNVEKHSHNDFRNQVTNILRQSDNMDSCMVEVS